MQPKRRKIPATAIRTQSTMMSTSFPPIRTITIRLTISTRLRAPSPLGRKGFGRLPAPSIPDLMPDRNPVRGMRWNDHRGAERHRIAGRASGHPTFSIPKVIR